MIIIEDATIALTSGPADEVVYVQDLDGTETVVAKAPNTIVEMLQHARVELHETVTVQEDGRKVPTAYLTVTVSLGDDEARASAYRLRDEARKITTQESRKEVAPT